MDKTIEIDDSTEKTIILDSSKEENNTIDIIDSSSEEEQEGCNTEACPVMQPTTNFGKNLSKINSFLLFQITSYVMSIFMATTFHSSNDFLLLKDL